MPLTPGDTLLNGQYRILHLLGQGGFGFVYHTRDTLLDRDVAIKELIPSLVGDPAWIKRFLVEARATLQLHHEHIVTTHTLFAESGNHYLVMEYMPGGSLEERLRQGAPLSVDDALSIAAAVCHGIGYAHQHGIVHCDLKPANILFSADGTAKVADFGIAHVSDQALSRSWATSTGFAAGTLSYMSPEQGAGERSDPRIDLYALGAILYRMVTGCSYLDFDSSETPRAHAENIRRICEQQPLPPSTHSPHIPPWLDALVLRLLAKRPDDRPATAADVLAHLQPPEPVRTLSARQAPPPAVPPPSRPTSLPVRRAPGWIWLAAGAALLLFALGISLALVLHPGGGASATPEPTLVVVRPAATLSPAPFRSVAPAAQPTAYAEATSLPELPSITPAKVSQTEIPAAFPAAPTESAAGPARPTTAPSASPTPGSSATGPTTVLAQGYLLPRSQPKDIAYDGSALWALFEKGLVRLEAVEDEQRFRAAEAVALYEGELPWVRGNSLAWDGSRQMFWVVQDVPRQIGGGIDLIDRSGHISIRYGIPEVLIGTPLFVAWDGESLWVSSDDGSIYKLKPSGDHLDVIDSYASAVEVVGKDVVSGLAWDGNTLWILVGDVIAKLDRAGQPGCSLYLSQSGVPVSWYAWRGLAIDGRFVWVAAGEDNKVYRLDAAACQP